MLHIAHLKLKQVLDSQNIILAPTPQSEPPVTHEYDDVSTSPLGPREHFASDATHSCTDDDTMERIDRDLTSTISVSQPGGAHEVQTKTSEDKEPDALTSSAANTTSGFASMGIENESFIADNNESFLMPNSGEEVFHRGNDPHDDDDSDDSDDDNHSADVLVIQPEGHNVASSTW